MTPREQIDEFLAAMKADGCRHTDRLADLMLQFSLSDDAAVTEAGDKIIAAMKKRHFPLRTRAREVAEILRRHIASLPAEH